MSQIRTGVLDRDEVPPRVTWLESHRTGRFHIVLRRGTDAQRRTALLVLKGASFATRSDAEAACVLLEVELLVNGGDYAVYETQVVVVGMGSQGGAKGPPR